MSLNSWLAGVVPLSGFGEYGIPVSDFENDKYLVMPKRDPNFIFKPSQGYKKPKRYRKRVKK